MSLISSWNVTYENEEEKKKRRAAYKGAPYISEEKTKRGNEKMRRIARTVADAFRRLAE